jgi:hypothetical protein
LNSNKALLTIDALVMDPVDPPAPILRVPSLIVVAPVYVFAAVSNIDPLPIFVNVRAPPVSLTTPESVRSVEEFVPILESAANVTVPLSELLPLLLFRAPVLLTPFPLSVMASAVVIPPDKLSVAPLLTVVAPAFVPRAVLLATTRVPALIDVVPV